MEWGDGEITNQILLLNVPFRLGFGHRFGLGFELGSREFLTLTLMFVHEQSKGMGLSLGKGLGKGLG